MVSHNILDLIDHVVAEHELLSADAMRWAPDAPDPTSDPTSDVQAWADRNGVVLNEWQLRVLRDALTAVRPILCICREVTNFGDLRVVLMPDGTMREEPRTVNRWDHECPIHGDLAP